MNLQTVLAKIRQQSDKTVGILPSDPETVNFLTQVRLAQLRAMLEYGERLTEAGVQIPAILEGGLRAEIDRLSDSIKEDSRNG